MKQRLMVKRVAFWCAAAIIGSFIGSAVAPSRAKAQQITCEYNYCSEGYLWDSCFSTTLWHGCRVTGVLSCETYECPPKQD